MPKFNWKTIRFIIIGGASALIYLICSYALITYLNLQAYLASLIAYAASFSFAYLGQKIWAFRSIAPHSRTLTRYAILQLFCAAFAAVFSQAAANQGSLSPLQLSTLASVLTAFISYFASSFWVFAEPTPPQQIVQAFAANHRNTKHDVSLIPAYKILIIILLWLIIINLYY